METQHTAISMEDNFYFSMLSSNSQNFENNQTLISDSDFAQELQIQEAIASSLTTLPKPDREKRPREIGESSKEGAKRARKSSSKSLCEICAETKYRDEMFPLKCSHKFCTDCISKHISIKIKRGKSGGKALITCPGFDCTNVLEIESCREVLPGDVISLWGDVLCELTISPSQKFYCPYNNCSGLLVKENGDGEVMREAECPFCHRLFCVKCNVPWHSGVDCEGFSKDERENEDIMVMKLAKKKKWKKCPNCNFFVSKRSGCSHMVCSRTPLSHGTSATGDNRCGFQFCYSCGKAWTNYTHQCRNYRE